MSNWPEPTDSEIRRAADGDPDAVGGVLVLYRDQLKHVVRTRLDARLRRRVDESDIVNDVLGAACDDIGAWLRDGKSVYACLHRATRSQMAVLFRDHVATQKRSVAREEAAANARFADDSIASLCSRLQGDVETPSRIVSKQESLAIVRAALESLPELDREIVVLRTLEGTPTAEVAKLLGLSEGAVKMRHLRALKRLRRPIADSEV